MKTKGYASKVESELCYGASVSRFVLFSWDYEGAAVEQPAHDNSCGPRRWLNILNSTQVEFALEISWDQLKISWASNVTLVEGNLVSLLEIGVLFEEVRWSNQFSKDSHLSTFLNTNWAFDWDYAHAKVHYIKGN